MNRHPVILDQLAPLLPPGGRRPETRLVADLRMGSDVRRAFASSIEEAWQITIDAREVAAWRTLTNVCATIANAREAQAA